MNSFAVPRQLNIEGSTRAFERTKKVIPGGHISKARARDHQLVFDRGSGAHLWDVDGNRYLDTVMAHGPVLLGHADPRVNAAAKAAADNGVIYGGVYKSEAVIGETILGMVPWADKITFMSTGTEAVLVGMRIAKAATGRRLVVKFDGHFHGWMSPFDCNLNMAELLTTLEREGDVPGSVPFRPRVAGAPDPQDLLVARWDDIDSFELLMSHVGDQVAAVFVEPFVTGYGTFNPGSAFFERLKQITHSHGALLVFDEIVSGFRFSPSGSTGITGVSPDIALFAKAIANGYQMSLIAGREDVMACIADGRMVSAGTYSAHPVSMEAAIATMGVINSEGQAFYDYLDTIGKQLKNGIEAIGRERDLPLTVNQIGSICQLLWGHIADPESMNGVYQSNFGVIPLVCEEMIARGVYTGRKGLFYLSRAHTAADIEVILSTFAVALDCVLSTGIDTR